MGKTKMKLKTISVTIVETLNCGNYETLRPEIQLIAELDKDDNPEECNRQLHAMASALWARNALIEMGWVSKRRDSNNKRHEFNNQTEGIRTQLKGLLQQPEKITIKETENKEIENKKTESESDVKATIRANNLLSAILQWKPDHRYQEHCSPATIQQWAKEIGRLHKLDGVSWERIDAVIDYLPNDAFWAPNIQSGAKLRKHFDRIEAIL
jgi:hypothetical protein